MDIIVVVSAWTVCSVMLLLYALSQGHYVSGLFKMLASTGFIAMAIVSGAIHSAYGMLILAGLICSWWGDLFLISESKVIFLSGLMTFLAAHLAYCAAFYIYGISEYAALVCLLALLIPAAVIAWWLHPHLGKLRLPVYAYTLVISVMLAFAVSAFLQSGGLFIPVGALLFYLSDVFVARDRFKSPGTINKYLGLPLYYAAQLSLAFSVWYMR